MPAPESSEARFFDGGSGRPWPARLLLDDAALTIEGEDGMLRRWPVADIRRADEGATQAMLRVAGDPARLVTGDAALLARLAAANRRLRPAAVWTWRRWTGVAAGIAAGVGVAALAIDQSPGLIAPLVPARLERQWTAGTMSVLNAAGDWCHNEAGIAALNDLMGRLATHAGLPASPPFRVLDAKLVNAFTLPDGSVVIMRGLIDFAHDPDEFSGVLAHELGHARRHDPTRETVRRLELSMLSASLGWGGGLADNMVALSYGRRAETAADQSALDTLHAAGLRADGLSRLFTRMQAATDSVPAFLSDHPTSADRADRLRTTPDGLPAVSDEQWMAIRAVCSP